MLGSAQDAEDMVQETFLRYQATPPGSVRSLQAFLTTIVTRLCLDQLQLARRKRELYVGPWLPEPIRTSNTAEGSDPAKQVEMQESISLAFLVLLEQLQPFERAVFLLRHVFDYEFAEIATILDKSEAAARRSFSRAKRHLQAQRPRFPASPQIHRQLLTAYAQAAEAGEMAPLMNLLAENVTLWADGGGNTRSAVLRPIRGRAAVARVSAGSKRFWPENYRLAMEEINGEPALVVSASGTVFAVLTLDVEQGQVQTIRIMTNPEKLAQL